METFIEGIKVVFFGVLMFSLIVVVHEAGHFAAARLFGLRVKEFMIGLPGPNIGFTFKGTKFGITPYLLGGYALIAGEGSGKENPHLAAAYAFLAEHGRLTEDEVRDQERTLGYDLEEALDVLDAWGTVKRVKKKGRYSYLTIPAAAQGAGATGPATAVAAPAEACAACATGPATVSTALGEPHAVSITEARAHIAAERKLTFNSAPWYRRVIILVAGVVFNLLFAIIVFTTALMIAGTQVPTTTLAAVAESSPAARAALQPGDTITAADGKAVDSWEAFLAVLGGKVPGDRVTFTVERGGIPRDYTITLADNNGRAMLGVTTAFERTPVSFVDALSTSVGFIGIVATAIVQLLNPATFGDVVSQSASVIGVSFEAKAAAESGFLPFIALAAALSISIGLMNLLPLPPLDGGRIVVETIERVTRRRIPVRVINGISVAAMALLVMLFLFVTNQDIKNYIIGG
ncbi:MAG: M50 family metallopeptidase [Coriobacteriales bacterium]|jgi:regulator of sigma E protease|nr:M50 family metallopeptidase [Coriobacteriales bacterium]